MTGAGGDEFPARIGLLKADVICRLEDDALSIIRGSGVTRIGYTHLAAIRFQRMTSRRAVLVLTPVDGRGLTLVLSTGGPAMPKIIQGVTALIAAVARLAPHAPLWIGPSRRQWLAACVAAVASGLVFVVVAGNLWLGQGLGPMVLPMAVASINLTVVWPILRAGRPRPVPVGQAPDPLF